MLQKLKEENRKLWDKNLLLDKNIWGFNIRIPTPIKNHSMEAVKSGVKGK